LAKKVLIVGYSGIIGSATAAAYARKGWDVLGLARNPVALDGVSTIGADLLDSGALSATLAGHRPDRLIIAAWLRQESEAKNIAVNGAMVRNILNAVSPQGSLEHVALVTGLKHYLGPFEAYGKGKLPHTPFREDQPRLDIPNFYYAQEDELHAAAMRDGFAWSVQRAHTVIGKAVGNAMNMGSTLAVYATICRETGRPFEFPGSQAQWDGLVDMTDANLLAEHLLWAADTPGACNRAFNVVNGDVFRWKWMWGQIADWFGIEAVPFDGVVRPLETKLANDSGLWREIAERHGLAEPNIDRLASAWHTDADLGRPLEVVADMSLSRRLGFTAYKPSDDAFFELFKAMRADRLLP